MANEVVKFIRNDTVQQRFEELLKERAPQITTSLISAVNTNTTLAKCEPETVVNAALAAAAMDLPINPNLGFAAIVPYYNGHTKKWAAQFQVMWKGFIQLAQRSGRYRTINAIPVYQGQLKDTDPLRGGFVWDWSVEPKGEPIGYAAFFELLNGFEKTLYMTKAQVDEHGKRYSQPYKKDLTDKKRSSLWSTDFDTMALKTVVKQLISKYGPMSTAIERALQDDQAILTDRGRVYIDNEDLEAEKATEEEKAAILAANLPTEAELSQAIDETMEQSDEQEA